MPEVMAVDCVPGATRCPLTLPSACEQRWLSRLVTTLLDKDGFEVIMTLKPISAKWNYYSAESMRGFHVADWTGDGAVELLEHVEGLATEKWREVGKLNSDCGNFSRPPISWS